LVTPLFLEERKHYRLCSVTATIFANYQIVINCTPIGTSPDTEASPAIPYHFTDLHIAYDLIYNPAETKFYNKQKPKVLQ
jgi:shikimate dehydrogenase